MDGMRWLIDKEAYICIYIWAIPPFFAPGSGKTLSETFFVNFDNFITHAHMIVQ